MIVLLLLSFGAAPPAQRDVSLPEGAFAIAGAKEKGRLGVVDALAYWPDGKVLVMATRKGVHFLHLPSGRRHRFVPALRGHTTSRVLLDAFGYTALFVTGDGFMHAYDLRRSRAFPKFPTNGKPLALALSADGSTIARAESGGGKVVVRIWDSDSGEERSHFSVVSEDPKKAMLALSPNGRLVSVFVEDRIKGVVCSGMLRTKNFREVHTFGDAPVLCMAFSGDAERLAVVQEGIIKLYHGYMGGTRGEHLVKGLRAEAVAFSPDNRALALASPGDREKKLELFELASGGMRLTRTVPSKDGPPVLAFSPRGGSLATDGNEGKPIRWDLAGRYSTRGGATPDTLKALFSRSAEKGQKAITQLMGSPGRSVRLLRTQLRPARKPPDNETIEQWIALADDWDEKLAARAQKAIVDAGYLALSPLRVARWEVKDKEVRAGLERLIEEAGHPVSRRRLRNLRAVEALERLGTPEARKFLKELAEGWPTDELTTAVWRALYRMERR
jgi:WD40 repeat protein